MECDLSTGPTKFDMSTSQSEIPGKVAAAFRKKKNEEEEEREKEKEVDISNFVGTRILTCHSEIGG